MKPRAFIGSSVEGLNIAYAIQQNLLHDVEITVWSQGIFDLSANTMESLIDAVSSTDFGIFVFSPDDRVKMRGKESASIRDNVLFEMGLFIGKLGRDRVFFLIPDTGEPHIPTDLLGINCAKYESGRSDHNIEAATGSACQKMRQQIKRIGLIDPTPKEVSTPSESVTAIVDEYQWFHDYFINKDFPSAKLRLEADLVKQDGKDSLLTKVWICACDVQIEGKHKIEGLIDLCRSHTSSEELITLAASVLQQMGYIDIAIKILEGADREIAEKPSVLIGIANCHKANADIEQAILLLEGCEAIDDPDIALRLSFLFEEQDNKEAAIKSIHSSYVANPQNESLRYRYALLAGDLGWHTVSLYFLDTLSRQFPESIEYWGYLGNSCLALQLSDKALAFYQKADSCRKDQNSNGWIISNIGNLFRGKGLFSEAISYLSRAIQIDQKSSYAHEKMACSLNLQDNEEKLYHKKISEGKDKLRELEFKRNHKPLL